MTYNLHRLAPGSYDLVLDGEVVGSVVREIAAGGDAAVWHAELLDDPPPAKRPHPFNRIDHTFGSLQAVTMWLGDAPIMNASEGARQLDTQAASQQNLGCVRA